MHTREGKHRKLPDEIRAYDNGIDERESRDKGRAYKRHSFEGQDDLAYI